MATLLLSQGVPMILAGDEFQRTTLGNNNTYCHDSVLTWTNWQLDRSQADFLEFTRFLSRFVRHHPVLSRRKFFQGTPVLDSRIKDLTWFYPDASEISDEEWQSVVIDAFGLLLAGNAIGESDERGRRLIDDTILILFNASPKSCAFVLPDEPLAHLLDRSQERGQEGVAHPQWNLVLDTRHSLPHAGEERFAVDATYGLIPHSLALFVWPKV
jgi:isoamylase